MALSQKQKNERQAATSAAERGGPVRIDAAATTGGKKGDKTHKTKSVVELHPDLRGGYDSAGAHNIEHVTITTGSGVQFNATKGPRAKDYAPHGKGMSPQQGKEPLPEGMRTGVSQRLRTVAGTGARTPEDLMAEADRVAANRPAVASDGMLNAVVQAHKASMGGNRPAGQIATSARAVGVENAAAELGYDDAVQSRMVEVAANRIREKNQKKTGSDLPSPVPALSEAEIKARAYGQVTEHLDEAVLGSRDYSHSSAVTTDALIQAVTPGSGMRVMTAAAGGRAAKRVQAKPDEWDMKAGSSAAIDTLETADSAPGSGQMRSRRDRTERRLGMTPSRSLSLEAAHQALKEVVTKNNPRAPQGAKALKARAAAVALGAPTGKWTVDPDAASRNDLEVLSLQQRARRAMRPQSSDSSTLTPGANIEAIHRANEQFVFSTNRPGVGVTGPVARGAKRKPKILPPRQMAPGEVNDIATPKGARTAAPLDTVTLGRLREERNRTVMGTGDRQAADARLKAFQTNQPTPAFAHRESDTWSTPAAPPSAPKEMTPRTRSGATEMTRPPAAPSRITPDWKPSHDIAATVTGPAPAPFANMNIVDGHEAARTASRGVLGQKAASGPRSTVNRSR